MQHPNLRSYLDTLKRHGELLLIEEPVSPHLELAEIQRRTVARQGPALLFSRVRGTEFPVVTNLFGTRRRIELALGKEPQRIFQRLKEAAEEAIPPSPRRIWQYRDLLRAALRSRTRRVRSAPVLERKITGPALSALPQIQCWPEDGGSFLTLPLVYTEDPRTGKPNLGMYRNQIYDDRTIGMHIQIHRGAGFHHHEAESRNQPLPANLFLGGPPALMLAAVAPLPENVSELVLAALLQGGPLSVLHDATVSPLPIVAETEFLLVGKIPPGIRRREGPFGDHYGYYSQAHDFPVMEITGLHHRKGAVFPATVVGRPRQEDHYIGEYLQELFAPLFPLVMNGVVDVWAYDDAGVHPLAAAVVRERYRREAFTAALRILGEGQLSLTKCLMVTDRPVDLKDFRSVLVHILERADFSTDLWIFSHVSQDTLDYSSPQHNRGSKAIFMGLGDKRFPLQPAPAAELRDPSFARQEVFAPGVLVVQGPAWRERDSVVEDLLREPAAQPFRLVCLVDDAEACTRDTASFLWTIFTRLEPSSDIHCTEEPAAGRSAPLLLYCRIKPWSPPPVVPDPETVRKVDALWPRIYRT